MLRQRARRTGTSTESRNRVACVCMGMPRRNASTPSLESRLYSRMSCLDQPCQRRVVRPQLFSAGRYSDDRCHDEFGINQ